MKNLILILLLFLFATSCKKETSVVILAQDYNTGDGSTYAGQKYAVAETWTPFQETKSEIVATGFFHTLSLVKISTSSLFNATLIQKTPNTFANSL